MANIAMWSSSPPFFPIYPSIWWSPLLIFFSNTNGVERGGLLQPHFWKSVKMTLTLPKWGLESPPGLLKLQSSITKVKTPCLEALFISLESYQSVDVENGLALAIWTFVAQVMAKKRVENQTDSLTSDH